MSLASKPVTDTQVQAILDARYARLAQIGANSGVAPLDSSGKVPLANMPATGGAVASVAGRTGAVVVTTADLADFANAVLARVQALGILASVREVSGTYPNRPATTAPVVFIGPDAPSAGGLTSGGTAAAVNGLDLWFRTP